MVESLSFCLARIADFISSVMRVLIGLSVIGSDRQGLFKQ
jgi:hypothetical protein